MSNIDNLNFKLLLDDKDFDKAVRKQIDALEKLNKELEGKGAKPLTMAQFVSYQKKSVELASKQVIEQNKINQAVLRTEKLQQQVNAQHSMGSKLLSQLGSYAATYFSVLGAERVVKNLVRVTSEFELQRTTLRAILQDIDAADEVYGKIRDFAVKSPFSFMELSTYVKQLSAYSIPVNELFETTKMLADVSAGLGVDMNRIVLAYGQIRSASFLRGQEVRQLTEAGIPILKELAKQFEELEGRAVSAGEVFNKISARQVPFEMVAKVFKDMTSEGGKFYNMQEIQAETLKGKLSNLKDAYDIMFSEIGNRGMPIMKDAVDWIRSLAANYEQTGREIMALIATYGLYRATLLTIELATGKLTLANTALGKSFLKLMKNPYVAIAAGVAAAGYGIYKWAAAMNYADNIQASADKTMKDYNRELATEQTALDALYYRLKALNEGTAEYDETKKALFSKYASYISELKEEGVEVQNLTDLYEGLSRKIEEAAKSRFKESGRQDLDETFGKQTNKAFRRLRRIRKQGLISDSEMYAFQAYISGSQTLEELLDRGLIIQYFSQNAREGERKANKNFAPYADTFDKIEEIRKDVEKAQKAYADNLSALEKAFDVAVRGVNTGTDTPLALFPKTVQEVLAKYGITEQGKAQGLWADAFTNYSDYLKSVRERYKELGVQIKDAGTTMKSFVPEYKRQREIIEDLFAALGVGLDGPKDTQSEQERAEQKRIEQAIDNLKALQSAYEKLRSAGIGDESMPSILSWLFPEMDQSMVQALRYEEQIVNKARELAKYNPNRAQDVLNGLGKDNTAQFVEFLRQSMEIRELLASMKQDTRLEGTGITYDISKIIHDYENAIDSIEKKQRESVDKFKEAQRSGAVTSADAASFMTQLVMWGDTEAKNALAKAEDAISGLADTFLKEWAQIKGINLSDWGDMTIGQLRDIVSELDKLIDEDGNLNVEDDNILSRLEAMLKDYPSLWEVVKDAIANKVESEEKQGKKLISEKTIKNLKQGAKAIIELTDALGEYAELSGNERLADTADTIKGISDTASAIAEGYKATGSWIGAAIAAYKVYIENLFKVASAYEQLRISSEEARMEMRLFNQTEAYKAGDSLFGDSFSAGFKQAMGDIDHLQKAYTDFLNNISYKFRTHKATFWEQLGASMGDGFAPNTYASIEGAFYSWGVDYNNLDSILAGLRKIRSTYSDLTEGNKEYLDQVIFDLQRLKNATEEVESSLEPLLGSMADEAASRIVDGWVNAGNAALDYADILDSVARSYAQVLVKDVLLENVFNDNLKKDVAELIARGDNAGAMAKLELAMQEIADKAPQLAEILEPLSQYFRSDNAKTVGAGIQSITEDTADLLASYINGMRTDLSAQRIAVEAIGLDMKTLTAVVPNIADYTRRIEANTANMAQHTSDMLADLRSMITSQSGEPALRVYM